LNSLTSLPDEPPTHTPHSTVALPEHRLVQSSSFAAQQVPRLSTTPPHDEACRSAAAIAAVLLVSSWSNRLAVVPLKPHTSLSVMAHTPAQVLVIGPYSHDTHDGLL
jgi:hypothetical protein